MSRAFPRPEVLVTDLPRRLDADLVHVDAFQDHLAVGACPRFHGLEGVGAGDEDLGVGQGFVGAGRPEDKCDRPAGRHPRIHGLCRELIFGDRDFAAHGDENRSFGADDSIETRIVHGDLMECFLPQRRHVVPQIAGRFVTLDAAQGEAGFPGVKRGFRG